MEGLGPTEHGKNNLKTNLLYNKKPSLTGSKFQVLTAATSTILHNSGLVILKL
jgi:hypothetical protein